MKKSQLIKIIREEIENLLEQPDTVTRPIKFNTQDGGYVELPGGGIAKTSMSQILDPSPYAGYEGPPMPVLDQVIPMLKNLARSADSINVKASLPHTKVRRQLEDIVAALEGLQKQQAGEQ